jgi:hypothetical protein
MRTYIDEGHEEGVKSYTEKEAISVIREIISDDLDVLREGETLENITDDRVLEIGYNFYSIYK